MLFQKPGLSPLPSPPLGYRFAVVFLTKGITPNPIDIRFQSVSGIRVSLGTQEVEKSSASSGPIRLGQKVQYDNLLLDRGVLIGSPLSSMLEEAFEHMQFHPMDVLVSVLNEVYLPVKTWKFSKAYPVSWSFDGINAANNNVLVEHIELTYSHFSQFSL